MDNNNWIVTLFIGIPLYNMVIYLIYDFVIWAADKDMYEAKLQPTSLNTTTDPD